MKIKKGLQLRTIAGEDVLIMQGHAGVDMTKIASFNNTAKWLWDELCEKEFSLDDITQLLVAHFNVDAATAETDADKWIEQLSVCNALES